MNVVIKTVIFDLGQVIVPFDLARGYAALQPYCPYPAEDIPRRLAQTDLVYRFEAGQMSPEAFVEQFSRLLGLRVGYDTFRQLWSAIFLPETIVPESMLAGIGERYRLLLLSNTNAIHWEMILRNYAAMRHFDDYVLSYEVGAMKPSPAIYEAAIARAGCRPEECFFTDDIPEYVEAARAFGIDAVQFTGVDRLEQELRARGIVWAAGER